MTAPTEPTVPAWLPPGARAAVCFSVDDVHPAASTPGGDSDIARAALDVVRRLQERHPRLKVTFFTTPDWRSASPVSERGVTGRIPILNRYVFQTLVLPAGTYRLARHPEFCATLRGWRGGEIALHGLHHVRRGPRSLTEFEGLGETACRALLGHARHLFDEAGVPCVAGLSPPGWAASPPLVRAMARMGMSFLASARDLDTPVSKDAAARGSGLRDVPLFRPSLLPGTSLVHVPTNFQATSTLERARSIVAVGALLSIKAHLLSGLGSYRALDGLNDAYGEQLHRALGDLEDAHGEEIWWPTISELAERTRAAAREVSA